MAWEVMDAVIAMFIVFFVMLGMGWTFAMVVILAEKLFNKFFQ